jgi:hypothetical protein
LTARSRALPLGDYTVVLALATRGATADDRLDPGELVTIATVPFTVAP